MMIVHEILDCRINFQDCPIWSLVIENANKYYELANDLYKQCNGEKGNFILTENLEEESFSKNAVFLYDVFNFSINSTKVDKLLNSQVLDLFENGDYISEINEINQKIISLNDKLLQEIDLPIQYDGDFDCNKFIKISNYKIQEDNLLLDRVCSFVDLMVKLKNVKIIILVGFYNYFSEQEINTLLKQFLYQDLKILLLNPSAKYQLNEAKQIIIDEDLCII